MAFSQATRRSSPNRGPATSEEGASVTGQDRSNEGALGTPLTEGTETGEQTLHLLVDHDQNRDLLSNWLGTSYDVRAIDGSTAASPISDSTDLSIVDGPGFTAHRDAIQEWKEREHPRFAPVVLVTEEQLSESFEPADWDDIDGLYIIDETVEVPVEKAVLHRRLDNLLQRRTLSASLSSQYERAEERFSALFHATPDPALVLGTDGTTRFANDALCELFGVDREAIVGESFPELVDLSARTWSELADVAGGSSDVETVELGDVVYETPEDETRIADVRARSLSLAGQGGATVVLHDVTERRGRERDLAESERRFRALFEAANDALVVADDEGSYIEANEAASDLYGLSREELLGRSIDEFAPDDFDFEAAWEQFLDDGEMAGEFDLVRPDGERRILEFSATANVRPGKHLSALRDVTERREVERELADTKDRLEEILDRIEAGFLAVDDDWTLTYFNRRAAEITGQDPDTAIGEVLWDVFPEAVGTTFEEEFRQALATQEPTTIERDSEYLDAWIEVQAYPGEAGLSVFFRDVTDRKQREQALAESEARFRQIAENVHEVIWMVSADGETGLYVSPGIEHLTGYAAEQLEDAPVETAMDAVHPEDSDCVRSAFETMFADVARGEADDHYGVECRLQGPQGVRWVEVDAYPVCTDGAVSRVVGIIDDITETKRREQELENQNERLEKFAGIVSHDLRNPLQVIGLHADAMLAEDLATDHSQPISDAVSRMERLIDDLLTLARHGKAVSDVEPVSLETVVVQSWQTVSTPGLTLENEVRGVVQADRSRLVQLFENLFRNAVDHGGPEVTVTVGDLPDGFYVADDGPGIPADERESVFEMGYTTAEDGTGFGLNIVQDVVEAHGWDVAVTESETGGARFEITGISR